MHHSRLCSLVIDCKTGDLAEAARFWAAALGRPLKKRVDDTAGDNYLPLETHDDEPVIEVQQVDHESRVHLDIESDDIEAEVRRLEALGAKRLQAIKTWVVMEAPTGQRFCVVRMKHPERGAPAKTWD